MRVDLFREEVFDSQRQSLLGHVFLAQPLSFKIITFLVALMLAAAVVCLVFIPYNQSTLLSGRIIQFSNSLQAEIFVPLNLSKEFPTGKKLLLSYRDYPHKEFGSYLGYVSGEGEIITPEKSILDRFTSDIIAPKISDEEKSLTNKRVPVYRVRIALEQDYVEAYDHQVSLSPGVLLQTEIVYKKQSLLSWLLFQS